MSEGQLLNDWRAGDERDLADDDAVPIAREPSRYLAIEDVMTNPDDVTIERVAKTTATRLFMTNELPAREPTRGLSW